MAGKSTPAPIHGARVAVVAPDARSLVRLRGPLIRTITNAGHRVVGLAPDLAPNDVMGLGALGAEAATYRLREDSVNPLAERRSIDELATILGRLGPDIVLGFGLKPMLVAALAARKADVARVVALVSRLDELALGPVARPGISLRWMMRAGLRACDSVVFHNGDDRARLEEAGLLPDEARCVVVPGRGVDLDAFEYAALPPFGAGLVFLMIARLEAAKGVMEFCEAARLVRAKAGETRFVLAGCDSRARDLIAQAALAPYAGAVEWVGEVADATALIRAAHVFVLPSWAEGMPPTVQEALAIGRPVIVADVPGSRAMVDERVNGVLVASQDARALAAAMEGFIRRPELMASMGLGSRLKAERRFDIAAINATWLDILGLAPA